MISLLCGADPKKCETGPTVRLPKGNWCFHVHGLVDSELAVNVEAAMPYKLIDGLKLAFELAQPVRLSFEKRGSEKYLTVTAERI